MLICNFTGHSVKIERQVQSDHGLQKTVCLYLGQLDREGDSVLL